MAFPLPERSAVADDTAATLEMRVTAGDDLRKELEFSYVHRDFNVDPPHDLEEALSLENAVLQSSIWALGDETVVDFFDIFDMQLRGPNWIRIELSRDRTRQLTPGTYGYAIWADDTQANRVRTFLRGTLTIESRPS